MLYSSDRYVLVSLAISPDQYLHVYRGYTNKVFARDNRGRCISFPANILKTFVTHVGVVGSFVIYFDQNNHFRDIIRVE